MQKNKGSDVLNFLCKNMSFLSLDAHEIVFKEGSFGTIFYIILKGKVSVCRQEKRTPEESFIPTGGTPKNQTNVKALKKLKVYFIKSFFYLEKNRFCNFLIDNENYRIRKRGN